MGAAPVHLAHGRTNPDRHADFYSDSPISSRAHANSIYPGHADCHYCADQHARGAAAHGYSHCDRAAADIDSYFPANRYPYCDRAANESPSAPATDGYPSSSAVATDTGTHLRTTPAILVRRQFC